MNDDEFSEKPSGFMLGKEFIIVLVIIFSGLSFTLGYFVGKSGTKKTEQAVESPAQFQQQVLPASVQSPSAAPPLQQVVLPPTNETVSPVAPVTDKPVRQQKSAESQTAKPAPEKSAQKVEHASALESKSDIYTVQIGAFKNIAEAKQLKAKFDKKGHKSFISTGKNKKAEKIFKVKTGEFKEKKEAEVLALKLKKTEGLQTYVTMKTE
jgi:cell division septation protein DedD